MIFGAIWLLLGGWKVVKVCVCAHMCLSVHVGEAAEISVEVQNWNQFSLYIYIERGVGKVAPTVWNIPAACTLEGSLDGEPGTYALFPQRPDGFILVNSPNNFPLGLASHHSEYHCSSWYFSDENHHFTESANSAVEAK